MKIKVDFLQEFSVINEKIESLAEENLQLKTHILEILSISNQVRKDQLVKQNIANACFACFSNLRYKISSLLIFNYNFYFNCFIIHLLIIK